MKLSANLIFMLAITTALSGCGATAARYEPVVDQPNANYSEDLRQCQQLAEQRAYLNDDVKTNVLAGAMLGAVLDGFEGALVGSTIAAGGRAWDTREERKQIVMTCLRGRGHRIAG